MYKITTFWYIILIILAVIYFYFYKYKKYDTNNNSYENDTVENFTPKINSITRPHFRNMRLKYDNFINNYNQDFIMNKLKRMNIY
jgi:hypothetical protein